MKHLQDLRGKIDEIDNNIIDLLAEREVVVKEIALYKKAYGLDIFQPERERQVLEDRRNKAKSNGVDERQIEEFFKLIMKFSRLVQHKEM